jgi:4-diphosphocytidyl-2-C-methyl-D-erythritol kinase
MTFAERAPAKVNLTLEVLGWRPDGFHEIRSVLQTIDICDYLYFDDGAGTAVTGDGLEWSPEKSLVTRALDVFREATGSPRGVSIKVEKRIPLLSGLGGDSSDAAAVLRGLNSFWGLAFTDEKLAGLAARLGSDVTYFLRGGTALAEGRGEKVTALPALPQRWVVLVVPDVAREDGKTGRMYVALKPEHFTDGAITDKAAAALRRGDFGDEMLFNTFENVAFGENDIRRVYVEHLLKIGAPHVHLAGSGPALFTMFRDEKPARGLYDSCRRQGMRTFLARTSSSL